MKRRAPDHRCCGTPVLRDIRPGKIPVAIHNEDGSVEGIYDLDPDMVRGVEHIAKGKRTTSRAILTELLGPALRHWREVRGT